MMRAPIVCIIIGFFFSVFYSFLYLNGKKTIKVSIGVLIGVGAIYAFASSNLNEDHLDFATSKVEETSDMDFVNMRFHLMEDNYNDGYSFMGNGVGRYGERNKAIKGGINMPDGEYMKLLAEQGFVGTFLVIAMFLMGIIKGIRHFKYTYFELFLLLMLIICMIGADPLTIPDKHCIMYWLALGQISKFHSKNV